LFPLLISSDGNSKEGNLVSAAQEKIENDAISVNAPDVFQLRGVGLHIMYATTSFDGTPRFDYQDAAQTLHFVGDEIRTVATEIGTLVTVTICTTIDSGSTTFTLLVPTVNLGPSKESPIDTIGITTIHRFSIVPAFNKGQLELYKVTPLSGTASFINF
jgi:hypothetical protein